MTDTIRASTRLLGVTGWPLTHTMSPPMQNAAIRAAGADFVYVAVPVAPQRLAEGVRGLGALGFRGCNVTIPHKVAVLDLMDELTPAAEGVGAVNTILCEPDGRLVGDNTDCEGAFDALAEETGTQATGGEVVILGAGGAARACAWGAGARGAARVTILNRTVEKAEALATEMQQRHPQTEYRVLSRPAAADLADARLVLQMTSLGMKEGDALPLDPEILPKTATALEAVYAPLHTLWRRACEARGIHVVDGLAMLVAQGALSFERWTGLRADRAAMRRALDTETKAR